MAAPIVNEASLVDPVVILERAFREAIAMALGEAHAAADPQIKVSQNPQFGDFQANFAMALAKQVGAKPRDIAQRVAEAAASLIVEIAEPLEVAGPGFINIRLRAEVLERLVEGMHRAELGMARLAEAAPPVVIDMCSVNVAKQMHVGHLRSAIIGDALSRILARLGWPVIRQNHLGDWGLQIGMVLHQLRSANVDLDSLRLEALERAYRDAQLSCKDDEAGLRAARRLGAGPHRLAELEAQNEGAAQLLDDVKRTLVRLQGGDAELVRDWRRLIDVTMRDVYSILELLGVDLGRASERGESFYRDELAGVVKAFLDAGLARRDAGAVVVPFPDRERPLLIQKSDGGYLYATTDLAAIRFRTRELGAGRVLYIVDARQRDHFKDVFDAARLIGWDTRPGGNQCELVHLAFGAVLGQDRRPLKTRSGENITLRALLDEAIDRATREVTRRAADPGAPTHGLDALALRSIGRAVGLGAVKYADLSNDVARDYLFDFDRMIAFEGNTGPYIQYAHARLCSILSKPEVAELRWRDASITIGEPAEKALVLLLLRYGAVVRGVGGSLETHRLCSYLYDLANAFSTFYQDCPVLRAAEPLTRAGRLRLCAITRDVIADGLGLLGIEAPPRM